MDLKLLISIGILFVSLLSISLTIFGFVMKALIAPVKQEIFHLNEKFSLYADQSNHIVKLITLDMIHVNSRIDNLILKA